MVKIEDLKKEFSNNISLIKQAKDFNKSYKSIANRNNELFILISYLETKTKEISLVKEREKLQKIVKSKKSQYAYWNEHVCPANIESKKRRALFNKETGVSELKKRIKTLNYILS